MHCVHNRYLRIVCLRSIISATLLSMKLELRKYLLYLLHRRLFSGTKSKHFCTPYLVSSCSRSGPFAPVLDARLLVGDE